MNIKTNVCKNGDKIISVYDNDILISQQITNTAVLSDLPEQQAENKIIQVMNSKFFLPYYKQDFVEKCIAAGEYFDLQNLKAVGDYLDKNSVVIDIGANIGNHTLFFANECHVKKIYAFEPIRTVYDVLIENIKINKLEKIVDARCIGLSDVNSKASIKMYDLKNFGGTHIKENPEGEIELVKLDSLNIKEKIDLIKIDVEQMDYEVLCGAKETILRDKPIIYVESFDTEFPNTNTFLCELGYEIAQAFKACCEYIYTPSK